MSKAGTYAKSSASSRIWMCKPVEETNPKKKRKQKDVIIHPIFERLSTKITDETWKDIFVSASKGKFPKGFGFNDNVLFFQRKNKTSSLTVGTEDSDEIMDSCKKFFRSMGGITSEKEQTDNSQEESADMSDSSSPVITLWTKVTPDSLRFSYLLEYLDKFGRKNRLSRRNREYLIAMINVAKCIGLLTDDVVIFKDGCVTEVKELVYNKETKQVVFLPLERPLATRKKKPKSKSKVTAGKFMKLWDKYLSLCEPDDTPTVNTEESKTSKKVVLNVKKSK